MRGDQRMRRPERVLEVTDGLHGHRVDELLVELRVAFAGRESLLGRDRFVTEVDRFVPAAARRVVVEDFDVFADRAGREPFKWNPIGDLVDARGVESGREPGSRL